MSIAVGRAAQWPPPCCSSSVVSWPSHSQCHLDNGSSFLNSSMMVFWNSESLLLLGLLARVILGCVAAGVAGGIGVAVAGLVQLCDGLWQMLSLEVLWVKGCSWTWLPCNAHTAFSFCGRPWRCSWCACICHGSSHRSFYPQLSCYLGR